MKVVHLETDVFVLAERLRGAGWTLSPLAILAVLQAAGAVKPESTQAGEKRLMPRKTEGVVGDISWAELYTWEDAALMFQSHGQEEMTIAPEKVLRLVQAVRRLRAIEADLNSAGRTGDDT